MPGASSALGLNATERTSANSKPMVGLSASLKKDLTATRRSSVSPPSTSDGHKKLNDSLGENLSSNLSIHQQDKDQKSRKKLSPTGRMLDSDGFEVV